MIQQLIKLLEANKREGFCFPDCGSVKDCANGCPVFSADTIQKLIEELKEATA